MRNPFPAIDPSHWAAAQRDAELAAESGDSLQALVPQELLGGDEADALFDLSFAQADALDALHGLVPYATLADAEADLLFAEVVDALEPSVTAAPDAPSAVTADTGSPYRWLIWGIAASVLVILIGFLALL